MAINIIKHGKATFKAVCPICGCEFTYQSEDLKEDCFHNHYVECPDCKQVVSHEYEDKNKSLDKDILWRTAEEEQLDPDKYPTKLAKDREYYVDYQQPNTIWDSWPDCATCPNRPDPTKTIIGDTPCTRCKKMQPYCYTGDIFPKDYKGGIYYSVPNKEKMDEIIEKASQAQAKDLSDKPDKLAEPCYYTDNEGNKHLLR